MNTNYHHYTFKGTEYSKEQQNTMRTAFLTAFPKIFTDIPYSNAIFSETIRLANKWNFSFEPEQFVANLAVELEARHKALSYTLREQVDKIGYCQVIELGAGLSSRRLEFKDIPYIEIDYPPMVEIKDKIYENLGLPAKPNELIGVDLTNISDLDFIVKSIGQFKQGKSVIIVSEGLFWYLSREDMLNLAKFVQKTLSVHGGLWITGDCPPKNDIYKDYEYRNVIAQSSSRQIDEPFSSFSDFENFFLSLGFNIDRSKLEQWVKTEEISSAGLFSLTPEKTLNRMKAYTDIAVLGI